MIYTPVLRYHHHLPMGSIWFSIQENKVTELKFGEQNRTAEHFKAEIHESVQNSPLVDSVRIQLDEFFSRKRKKFDLPLNLIGTPFQKKVWASVTQIPFGTTVSYKWVADSCSTRGYQSVGAAIGRNPICLIVPCHRVINHDQSLGGYSGGLEMKDELLRFEGRY